MNYKNKAEGIVEKYIKQISNECLVVDCRDAYCFASVGYIKNAAKGCAILEVEGTLDVIKKINEYSEEPYAEDMLNDYSKLINELKKM